MRYGRPIAQRIVIPHMGHREELLMPTVEAISIALFTA